VDTPCQLIQETLVEVAGDTSGLSEVELRHIDSCASCGAMAAAERRLEELLEEAVPPAYPAIEASVMRSLSRRTRHHQLVALFPVVASALLALVGVVAIGGVPGGSLLSSFPAWSARGWFVLVNAVGDWTVALAAASRAAQLNLPPLAHVAAVVGAMVGMASVVVTTRRWRTLSPWRSRA
jgi:hypothetical protein